MKNVKEGAKVAAPKNATTVKSAESSKVEAKKNLQEIAAKSAIERLEKVEELTGLKKKYNDILHAEGKLKSFSKSTTAGDFTLKLQTRDGEEFVTNSSRITTVVFKLLFDTTIEVKAETLAELAEFEF